MKIHVMLFANMKINPGRWMTMTALTICTLAQGHSEDGPRLLVVNQGDKTLSVVDPRTNKQVTVLDEQQTTMHGHEVAASPDGRFAYMPIYGNVGVGSSGLDGTEMIVFDLRLGKIVGRVDFGHGVRPHCVVYSAKNKLLYVTTELDNTVTIVDPSTLKILGSIPTTQTESHMLAISSDGKRGYTANVNAGTVSVLNLVKRTTIGVIPISKTTQRIAISVDDRWVFTSDQTQPRLAVIDTKLNTVSSWVDLPGNGYGAATTPNGKWLLVPVPSKDLVAVIDLRSMKVTKTISVERSPQEMLVRPDGKFAYVASSNTKKVSIIDLDQLLMVGSIDVGNYPDGLAWAK